MKSFSLYRKGSDSKPLADLIFVDAGFYVGFFVFFTLGLALGIQIGIIFGVLQ